ncbi:hypothetical protein RB594_005334 [Gaeumannomyces avenae]
MARTTDSPMDSPLSSMDDSDAFHHDAHDGESLPPAKRPRLGDVSTASSAVAAADHDPLEGLSPVSSDTSGEIPSSPTNPSRPEDDDLQEQVTTCAWEGCRAGDLANMDRLVEHIHNDHIEGKQKKYTCEWVGCARKSMQHASGYALKAHMRSHTREKPFYCYLPECDRSFTRSDALAKHMRTVHETEALRPSDPVPKSMQNQASATKSGKPLMIVIKTPRSHAAGHKDSTMDDASSTGGGDDSNGLLTPMNEDQGFTSDELRMPLQRLHGLCRMQLKWSEEHGEDLQRQIERAEASYKRAWLEKEILLHQVIQNEMGWHERRQAVLNGDADVHLAPGAMLTNGAALATAADADAAATPSAAPSVNGDDDDAAGTLGTEDGNQD